MQILIPSSTPLQVSWCMMSGGSTSPGFLWVLGTRQRTKLEVRDSEKNNLLRAKENYIQEKNLGLVKEQVDAKR